MTTKEAKDLGKIHASQGGILTPHSCQEFDKKIMAATKADPRPIKAYAKLRAAFNRGWQEQNVAN